MSGAFMAAMCARCGKRRAEITNPLIGGVYCKPCDRYITSPSPDLEARYNTRQATREKETAP